MKESIFEKLKIEKALILIIIGAIFVVFIFFFYLFYGYSSKKLEIVAPLGGESWEIGETYTIKWKSRGVDRVGIVLFNGEKPEWIAENISASSGEYEWRIQPGHEYGSNFWIAVFEHPWRNKNEISYSLGSFSIVYPELSNCDFLSIQNEWPFLASDAPNVRRVFITDEEYIGNLGGLEGADEKCQTSAEKKGYGGQWIALIGGESPENTIVKRMESTLSGLGGVFVEADSGAVLLRGATCHRLLGSSFDELLAKFSAWEAINKNVLSDNFLKKMGKVWLGRINESSLKNCLPIDSTFEYSYSILAERYSYTTTCQNWTQGTTYAGNYQRGMILDDSFPYCYTPTGEFTYVGALGGLSSALKGERGNGIFYNNIGKSCSTRQYLVCVEQ
ncbi:MAG: Ser-Thr-rich GPI-anchored membrane family protein [Candidatus Pacebacteria bacterium]|nr:Ser-Thr-rich GPI-anchored membrane family protein [Candidatus Paceibacterota bacterium]